MGKKIMSPRCMGSTKDGTQCGHRVRDGSQPPLCDAHNGSAPKGIIAYQAAAVEPDLMQLLKDLTKSRDKSIQMRAIELLLKREEVQQSTCAVCEERVDNEAWFRRFVKTLTPEEDAAFEALYAQHDALTEQVYARRPSLRPSWILPPPEIDPSLPVAPVIAETPTPSPVVTDEGPAEWTRVDIKDLPDNVVWVDSGEEDK